jgi:hypothetical protein
MLELRSTHNLSLSLGRFSKITGNYVFGCIICQESCLGCVKSVNDEVAKSMHKKLGIRFTCYLGAMQWVPSSVRDS